MTRETVDALDAIIAGSQAEGYMGPYPVGMTWEVVVVHGQTEVCGWGESPEEAAAYACEELDRLLSWGRV